MKMKYSFFMCFYYLLWKKYSLCKIFRYLTGYKISLCRCYICIFIWVFFHYILVAVFYKAHDGIISSVCPADHLSCISIDYILLCKFKFSLTHELLLYHILNILNHHVVNMLVLYSGNNRVYFLLIYLLVFINFRIGFLDRNNYLIAVIINDSAIPLDYLHHHISSNLCSHV